jgi:hypothetical protein
MFYLSEFFKTLWELKGRGIFFCFTTVLVAITFTFKPTVSKGLVELAPDAWARPYFTALFDSSVSSADVLKNIESRPEVQSVEILVKTETQGVLGRLISQIGGDYQAESSDIASFGYRVILKNKAAIKNGEELLQGLETSYGSEHVTTSGIRSPKVGGMLQNHPVFNYLSRFGYLGVVVPLMLIWFFSLAMVYSDFNKKSWLIERFQRRSHVRAKIMGAGFCFIISFIFIASLIIQGPDLVAMVLCLISFSIPWATTLREVKWQSQN